MAGSPAVRVGIIVFLAVLLFTGVYWFLQGRTLFKNTYTITVIYNDAQGLTEGASVTLAGVPIGQVESINLDTSQRAVVEMRINKQYSIPEGSRFVLRGGLLVGEKTIDIIPNREAEHYLQPGDVVQGQVPIQVEDLLPKAQVLIENLTVASENLNDILGDKELKGKLYRTFSNVEKASIRLEQTMASLQGIVVSNKGQIDAIIANVRMASENVNILTSELAELANQPEVGTNIAAALASARRSTESLERTVTSLESLVTAPEFQEDIRETISTARATVEQANKVLERVGKIIGVGGKGGGPKITLPTRKTSLDTLYSPDDGTFRATLTTTLGRGSDRFLNLGLYDVGGDNKLILQPGRSLGASTDVRYGIYASRLGVGLDHNFSDKAFGSINFFDPHDPRANLQAGYQIDDETSLLLGVDRLFDDNQFMLGVRLTR